MSKRVIGNTVAWVVAVAAGLATVWGTKHYLKEPEGAMDWVVLLLSGVTTGVLAFFVAWGHFQDEPKAEGEGGGR